MKTLAEVGSIDQSRERSVSDRRAAPRWSLTLSYSTYLVDKDR